MKTTHLVTILGAATVLAGSLAAMHARHHSDSAELNSDDPDQESGPPSERAARRVTAHKLARRLPSFVPTEAPPAPQWAPVHDEARSTALLNAFEAETRDPDWAPAMENALAQRFDPGSVPSWLAAMSLETMECHAHSCRMVVRYPADLTKVANDLALARATPLQTPLEQFVRETGPVAGSTSVVSTENASDDNGSSSVRVTAVLAFGPDEADPARYHDWVASHRR